LIVTDKATVTIGNALNHATKEMTPNVEIFVLEDYGNRPLTCLPEKIKRALPKANVTFWVAQAEEGEFETLRAPFVEAAIKYARHGHMPGITVRCMEEGMCSNYKKIVETTQKLYEIVISASRIDVTNHSGTKLRVEFDPELRWVKDDGMYHKKGDWGNLPAGELFTAPAEVNGKVVFDELGDWFCEKYGLLTSQESNFGSPVHINVEGSRANVATLECNNPKLRKELVDYLKTDENSNRAGEFALPTNVELLKRPLIGNMLQDEKARVHLAFGDPVPELTKANWHSKTHVDGLMEKCHVWIDGKKIMEAGNYIIF